MFVCCFVFVKAAPSASLRVCNEQFHNEPKILLHFSAGGLAGPHRAHFLRDSPRTALVRLRKARG